LRPVNGSLAERASRAFGWSFASNAVARLGSVPITIVLARLLGPHGYGTFAVALVALTAVLSFNNLGVNMAVVRWQGDPAEIVPTVTTLSVGCSLVTYGGCFLAAPAFASGMGAPAAADVIRVLALNVVLDGFTATPVAIMQRCFSQNRKAIADQVYTWLGALLSLALVWDGFGAMGMALGWVIGAAAGTILYWTLCPGRVRFGFDRGRVGELCRFGLPLAGSAIVVFGVTNVDQFVVGHLLGPVALGYYALALNLATWPVNVISWPTRAVVPAVFSRLQHDPQGMGSGFVSMANMLGSFTLPFCAVVAGTAVPLVGLVYGARWLPAAHVLTWLAAVAALRILFEYVYDFFVVLARTRFLFTVQVVWFVVLVPALVIGTRADGISGAGVSEGAVAAFVVLPWYLGKLGKIGIPSRALAARFWLPLAVAAAVCTAAAFASAHIRPDLGALAASAAFGLIAIGALGYRMRDEIKELGSDLRQRPAAGLGGGLAEPVDAEPLADECLPVPVAARISDEITEPLPACRDSAASPQPAASDPLPGPSEMAGSLPLDADEAPPIWRETVHSLGWDPASGGTGHHRRDLLIHTAPGPADCSAGGPGAGAATHAG